MISSSAAVHLLTWRQLVVLQQRQVRDATRRLQCHNQRPCWRRVLLLYCSSVCRHLENLQRRSDLHCFCTCRSVVASLFIKKAHAYLTYTVLAPPSTFREQHKGFVPCACVLVHAETESGREKRENDHRKLCTNW